MLIIFFIECRITFINAFRLFLSGAVLNGHHVNEYFDSTSYCFTVRPGVFAGAAVLSLVTVVLGIVCYLALDSAKISNNSWGGTAAPPNQGGIAMGLPQFPTPQYPPPQYPPGPPPQYPPQNTEAPIFVHEDTYMRRQFTWWPFFFGEMVVLELHRKLLDVKGVCLGLGLGEVPPRSCFCFVCQGLTYPPVWIGFEDGTSMCKGNMFCKICRSSVEVRSL